MCFGGGVAAGQSNFLLIRKMFLSFVAGTALLLLVHSFFLLRWGWTMFGRLYPFRLLLARTLFVGCLNFIPLVKVVLFFVAVCRLDTVAVCIFQL